MQESLAQTVPMTVFQAAKAYESEIPQDVFARWKNLFFQAYQTNVRVQQAQADMAEIMRVYVRNGVNVPIRVDHVPTMAGEVSTLPGYDALGRLFAIGYLKGIMQSVEGEIK
jgi:D-mannonate dehydratase